MAAAKKKSGGGGLLLIMLLGFAHFKMGIPLPGLSSLSSSPHGGTKGCAKLEHLWEKAGGNSGSAPMAAAIALAESGGRQYAANYDRNGTVDRGYWQINSINAGSSFNPMINAGAAVRISGNGNNWEPWVTYQRGMEHGFCGE